MPVIPALQRFSPEFSLGYMKSLSQNLCVNAEQIPVWLRALTWVQFPAPTWWLTTTLTLVPELLVPFAGLRGYQACKYCTGIHPRKMPRHT